MNDSTSPEQEDRKRQSNDPYSDPGSTTVGGEDLHIKLLQTLLDNKVISPAQGQLLLADQEVTGMTLDEVILARGWITESKLDEIAPWRKQAPKPENVLRVTAGSKNYQQNFKQYRALMEKILGVSWD